MLDNVAFGIIIGLLFVSLLVLFCFLLIKLYIRKIKNYTRVIYQKDIDFQKALTSTIIETQEQVLNNISEDLHDDAGQQLTFINFLIENFKLDHPELIDLLDPLSQSAYNLSESIRGISHSLNNQLILKQDLIKAIETETKRLRKNGAITINYICNGSSEKEFNTNEKIVIYRIFQEIVNNCFKHSEANQITIQLDTEPCFKMTIIDNGKGFNYDSAKENTTSLGLSNMINRAEIINYTIIVDSALGEGTSITLSEKQVAQKK